MVSSYLRIRCPLEEAKSRYSRWLAKPEVAPPRLIPENEKVDLALSGQDWLGLAVFFYASGPWTVIEEISGGLSGRSAENWLELAQGGDLVYAGYNDAIAYAELVVVELGRLVRHYLQDEQDPSQDSDIGQLPEEARQRFESWIDVMSWIEEDEDKLQRPEQGWLWIHKAE